MSDLIPKVIYTTWISDKPIPAKYQKYIDSWARVMPDYKIQVITLDNVKRGRFVDYAISIGNYALAGHYARVQELYNHGGIYFDIDVEAVKPLDCLLAGELVLGCEDEWVVNNAVILAKKKHPFLKECMDYMDNGGFSKTDIELETGPRMFTNLMKLRGWRRGLVGMFDDISILPPKYFYPYRYDQYYTPDCITSETLCLHHWANSWNDRVSIVIPCYNQGRYVTEAVDSALAQTYKNIEVIVVNDGSTDNTAQVLKRYSGNKKVKVVTQANRGLSAARNAGIKVSSGGWILPLDADDKIHPEYIEKTIGKADIVCPYLQCFGISTDVWKPTGVTYSYDEFLKHNRLFCCALFKKDVWTQIGGYDEQMWRGGASGVNGYEDWEFWQRATQIGASVKIVPEVLFYYRKTGNSMTNEALANHHKILAYMRSKRQKQAA